MTVSKVLAIPKNQVTANATLFLRLSSYHILRNKVYPHIHTDSDGWQKPIPGHCFLRCWGPLHTTWGSFHNYSAFQAQVRVHVRFLGRQSSAVANKNAENSATTATSAGILTSHQQQQQRVEQRDRAKQEHENKSSDIVSTPIVPLSDSESGVWCLGRALRKRTGIWVTSQMLTYVFFANLSSIFILLNSSLVSVSTSNAVKGLSFIASCNGVSSEHLQTRL